MSLLKVIVLAVVQGLAELLPVSSSAHVVVAEKLMGLDPSSPQMTMLLVMLHTGTMFAVILFFWKTWKQAYFASTEAFKQFAVRVLWATLLTGVVGEAMKKVIEKTLFRGAEKAEIEQLFSHLELIAPALAAAGVLIIIAGLVERRQIAGGLSGTENAGRTVTFTRPAGWALCRAWRCLFEDFLAPGLRFRLPCWLAQRSNAQKDSASPWPWCLHRQSWAWRRFACKRRRTRLCLLGRRST